MNGYSAGDAHLQIQGCAREGRVLDMGHKNSYIFTNKSHSQKGIMATILGIISWTTLIYAIVMSYRSTGDIPIQYGAAVLLAMLFSLAGAALGVISRTERDKYYFFSYLGILLNLLALGCVSAILYAGAYAV